MMLRGSAFLAFGVIALALALVGSSTACGGAAPSELLEGTGSGESADGGPTSDSGPRDSAAGGADAHDGATGTDPGVHCPNSGDCPVPGEVCCRQTQGDTCVAAGSCSGLAIPCDDSADCATAGMAGTVCCLINGPTGMASSVKCLPPSQCFGVMGQTAICDRNAANICPTGQSCLPSQQSLPGFDICR
jgi:hypothetical protein